MNVKFKLICAFLTIVINNSRLFLAAVDRQTDDLHLHEWIDNLIEEKGQQMKLFHDAGFVCLRREKV